MKKFTITDKELQEYAVAFEAKYGMLGGEVKTFAEKRAYKYGFIQCMIIINKKLENMGLIDKKGGE